MYFFHELSSTAKEKAVKDYINGWAETHPDEPLNEVLVTDILETDLSEDLYTEVGDLISDEEE
jgi:hypothetical protein